MMSATSKGLAAAIVLLAAGCMLLPGGKKSLEVTPTGKVDYQAALEAAVKGCRELDLPVNLVNKEVGQVQCGLKSSEVNFFSVGYAVDTLIERNGDAVRNVSVKVIARSGGYAGIASDADADAAAQRYLAVLQSAGVK